MAHILVMVVTLLSQTRFMTTQTTNQLKDQSGRLTMSGEG